MVTQKYVVTLDKPPSLIKMRPASHSHSTEGVHLLHRHSLLGNVKLPDQADKAAQSGSLTSKKKSCSYWAWSTLAPQGKGTLLPEPEIILILPGPVIQTLSCPLTESLPEARPSIVVFAALWYHTGRDIRSRQWCFPTGNPRHHNIPAGQWKL